MANRILVEIFLQTKICAFVVPAILGGRWWKGRECRCLHFCFQWNFQEWLFEQNVINDEKRSGRVQKEKSTLYLRPFTESVLRCLSTRSIRSYFSSVSSTWVVSVGPHHTRARVFSNFSLKPPKLSNLSTFQLSRDEYFNGGRRFFSSPTHACFRPRSSRAIMDCASSKRATLFRTPESLFPVASTQFRSAVSLSINVLLCSRENIYGPREIFFVGGISWKKIH